MGMRIKTWVVDSVQKWVCENLPIEGENNIERWVDSNYKNDSSTIWYRRIWFATAYVGHRNVHYEYIDNCGDCRLELHFEKGESNDDIDSIVNYVRKETRNMGEIEWYDRYYCFLKDRDINSEDDLYAALRRMVEIFDPFLKQCATRFNYQADAPYEQVLEFEEPALNDGHPDVFIQELTLSELFLRKLTIPPYQRIYCWQKRNITELWNDLIKISQPHHLGTVILQCVAKADGSVDYNIIDGQQRLVTLTLIMRRLGIGDGMQLPLLKEKFSSKEAVKNVGNAKAVISQLWNLASGQCDGLAKRLWKNVTFSVIVINNSNLDVAYTFFANQNSGGVKLSDFDILKAHHLRYINRAEQQMHLAAHWNMMLKDKIDENGESAETFMSKSLGTHIFRMRKWMRKNGLGTGLARPVKDEFQAAITIPEIPAFGEKFSFYEKIQGGSHFFAYANAFANRYRQFLLTRQAQLLRHELSENGEHGKFSTVIETFLFAYYLKFGGQYLSEALYCIASHIAQHRYDSARTSNASVLEMCRQSEIIMMIDQASSPTFFLAEMLESVTHTFNWVNDAKPIMERFHNALGRIFNTMVKWSVKDAIERRIDNDAIITENKIINLIQNEY